MTTRDGLIPIRIIAIACCSVVGSGTNNSFVIHQMSNDDNDNDNDDNDNDNGEW